MKKFLINIICFCVLLIGVDRCMGGICDFLRENAKGGATKELYYIANESTDDVVVFGSSRANHHYVPQIIEDSLELTCFNMGQDGNGIVLMYGRCQMLLERYNPKLIVYDVSLFDFCNIYDNSRYLDLLKEFYDKDCIKKEFAELVGWKEMCKLSSKMFQANSKVISMLGDNVLCQDINKGYIPLYGVVTDSAKYQYEVVDLISWELDSVKLSLFERFVCDVKERDIPLIMFVSPIYARSARVDYVEAEKICAKYDVPFYYLMEMDGIADDYTMFQDRTHMNNIGAEKYTREIIPLLREALEGNNKLFP